MKKKNKKQKGGMLRQMTEYSGQIINFINYYLNGKKSIDKRINNLPSNMAYYEIALPLLKKPYEWPKINNETISKFKNEVLKTDIFFENEFEVNFKNFLSIRRLFFSLYEKFSEKVLIHKGSFNLNDTFAKIRNVKNKSCCQIIIIIQPVQ